MCMHCNVLDIRLRVQDYVCWGYLFCKIPYKPCETICAPLSRVLPSPKYLGRKFLRTDVCKVANWIQVCCDIHLLQDHFTWLCICTYRMCLPHPRKVVQKAMKIQATSHTLACRIHQKLIVITNPGIYL